ncbi:MAG: hypothetical protein DI640_15395, partial [Sphingomonas taxi]
MTESARRHATPLRAEDLDLRLSARGRSIYDRVAAFMDERVMPVERELSRSMDALEGPEPVSPL